MQLCTSLRRLHRLSPLGLRASLSTKDRSPNEFRQIQHPGHDASVATPSWASPSSTTRSYSRLARGERPSEDLDLGYCSMEDPKNDLRRLGSTKRAQVLIPGPIDAVTVHVDTYLTVPEKFELRARNPRVGFTRAELVISITGMYQYVYRVEEETMGMGEAPYVSLNRGYTLGKYQIYGHSLGDLILHTAYYNPEKRSMTLGMDS